VDRPRRRSLALATIVDRTRRLTFPLTAALAAAATLASAAAVSDPPVRALAWLASGTDPVSALDRPPGECLTPPTSPDQAYAVEIGRAAFRTPLLLGGQAARAGVSCESCHTAGRTNPAFDFPGVSGPPGTADVTSSVFSSHRGDGVDNPKPIPDLSGPKSALKVPQSDDGAALTVFIRGLITEEFDGHEPAPAVLAGLVAYVRTLSPAACPTGTQQVTAASMIGEARRAAAAARLAVAHEDSETALMMVAGARWRLGLIDERFRPAGLRTADAQLKAADTALAEIAEALRSHGPGVDTRLAAWIAATPRLERLLTRQEAKSLFDPGRLRAEAARLPPRG